MATRLEHLRAAATEDGLGLMAWGLGLRVKRSGFRPPKPETLKPKP